MVPPRRQVPFRSSIRFVATALAAVLVACDGPTVPLTPERDGPPTHEATIPGPPNVGFTPDIIVTSTTDAADFGGSQQVVDLPGPDGLVSLREAIVAANETPGPQVIAFDIPTSDPGFDGSVFTFRPAAPYEEIAEDGAVLDGWSQMAHTGDTNPTGPEIVLNGADAPPGTSGLMLGRDTRIEHVVINGFPNHGVEIAGDDSALRNSYIGTDPTGTFAVPNGQNGMWLFENRSLVEHNVISGNGAVGIQGNNTGHVIRENHIGADASGTAAIPNTFDGMHLVGAGHLVEGNVFSGNTGSGMTVGDGDPGYPTGGMRILDNRIGVDVNGDPLGNGPGGGTGIIANGLSEALIQGNWIAHNNGAGVSLMGESVRVTVSMNAIHSNGGLGIDLAPADNYHGDGVTPNDAGDGDTGTNEFMNFPVISEARGRPGGLTVTGTLDTPSPETAVVEVFANPAPDPGGDPSGYGEGAVYLGSVSPDPSGAFAGTFPAVEPGTLITATATDAQGNTSELAENVWVASGATGELAYVGHYAPARVSLVDVGSISEVAVIDLSAQIDIAANPVVSPDGKTMWIPHSAPAGVSKVDVETGAIVAQASLPAGTDPYDAVLVPRGGGTLFVTMFSGHSVAALDAASMSVEAIIPLTDASDYPNGIAAAPGGRHVYVGNQQSGRVHEIDTRSLQVSGIVETGAGDAHEVVVTEGGRHVLALEPFQERLVVIDVRRMEVEGAIDLPALALGVAAGPGGASYVVGGVPGGPGFLAAVDLEGLSVIDTVELPRLARRVAVNRNGKVAVVTGQVETTIVDLTALRIVGIVPTGGTSGVTFR